MIASGTEMCDLQENKVIIEKTDDYYIHAVIIQVLEVRYNNGSNIEKQIVEQSKIFNKNDLGINLFFSKDDIQKHKNLKIKDKRYLHNYDNIYKYFSTQFESRAEQVKEDKPIGQILTPKLKDKLIRSYYSYDNNIEIEKEFHSKNTGCFGRIDLDTEFYRTNYEMYHKKHYYDKVYISKGTYHTCGDIHIVNWRSPIASMYYDNENTKLTRKSYVDIVNETRTYVNYLNQNIELEMGNPLNVYNFELMLKRSFSFNPLRYKNLYIADDEFYLEGSTDSFLLEILEENRTNHKITDIIKSIQSNQNKMIRHAVDRNMLVQGCAGSGKTMILLHRISYLLFNDLLPYSSEVKIITPNENFAEFIRELVNSLELDSIERTTMFNYYLSLVKRYQKMFNAIEKRDIDGDITNQKELKCNKEALNYITGNNGFVEENDDIFEREIKLNEDFFDEIKKEYVEEVNEICKKINSERLLEIANRIKTKYTPSIYGTKIYFDNLYNLSLNEIKSTDEKRINKIKELQKAIENNKKAIAIIDNTLDDFKVIKSYIDVLNEYRTMEKNSFEYLSSVKLKLIDLHKLFVNKTNYINNLNAECRKKSQDLQNEIDLLKSKIKSIPFYQFNHKKTINDSINKKATELTNIKNLHEKYYTKAKTESDNLKIEFNNMINTEFPDLEKPLTSDNFIDKIDSFLIERENDKSLIASKEKIRGLKESLVDKVKSTIAELRKINLKSDFSEVNIPGGKYLEDVISSLADILYQIGDSELNISNTCQKSTVELKETVTAELKKLSIQHEEMLKLLLTDDEKIILSEISDKLQERGMFVIDIYEKIRNRLRLKLNNNSSKKAAGKIEIIILLYLYYLHCNEIKEKDYFLFVDEGQDYSVLEYKLLKLINGDKCVFNIFGDVKQLLNINSGIENWETLKKVFNYDYYELKENYRNTNEITNFVNKKFKYDLNPIGIHGNDVQYIKLSEVPDVIESEIKANMKNRIAVISKNGNDDVLGDNYKDNNFYYSVKDVKGLEFDIAFVITEGMNKNEEYISYTRALNKLYVI